MCALINWFYGELSILEKAVIHSDLITVSMLIQHGYTNIDKALIQAKKHNKLDIVQYLEKLEL